MFSEIVLLIFMSPPLICFLKTFFLCQQIWMMKKHCTCRKAFGRLAISCILTVTKQKGSHPTFPISFFFLYCIAICPTKVIREKSHGGRFLWNKNWDLGWIWAGSATFEAGFLMFSWAKKIFKNILDGENIFGIEWN